MMSKISKQSLLRLFFVMPIAIFLATALSAKIDEALLAAHEQPAYVTSVPEKITQTEPLELEADKALWHETSETAVAPEIYELPEEEKAFTPGSSWIEALDIQPFDRPLPMPRKAQTVLIYIAGDNDLISFAFRNIEQAKRAGSSDKLNILIHFDYHLHNTPKESRFFYVDERGRLLQVGKTECMDSGDEKTLIQAATRAIKDFPSDQFALVLWNHGSGDLNPFIRHSINPAQLFFYNPDTKMIELDRSIGFIDFVQHHSNRPEPRRGICFDETTGNYLDDTKLLHAFEAICKVLGKKIDNVILDACLMMGVGMAQLSHQYVKFMTGSQEVVLGPGYEYTSLLRRLNKETLTPQDLALHVVDCYKQTYGDRTQDYTQSAVDLAYFPALHKNIHTLAEILLKYMRYDQADLIRRALKLASHPDVCTCFDEPSYKDYKDFLFNLRRFCQGIELRDGQGREFYAELNKVIEEGLAILQQFVIKSVAGKNLNKAGGISVYFPQYGIHGSYPATEFAKTNRWLELLRTYFSRPREIDTI